MLRQGEVRQQVRTPFFPTCDLMVVSNDEKINTPEKFPVAFATFLRPDGISADLLSCRHLDKRRLLQSPAVTPTEETVQMLGTSVNNLMETIWNFADTAQFVRASFCPNTCNFDPCDGSAHSNGYHEYLGKKYAILLHKDTTSGRVLLVPLSSDGMATPRVGLGDIVLYREEYGGESWFTEKRTFVKVINASWMSEDKVLECYGKPNTHDVADIVQRFHAIFDYTKYMEQQKRLQ